MEPEEDLHEAQLLAVRAKATSGVKWTTAATFVVAGLQVMQLALIARLLTPSDFGLFALVLVVVGFGQAFADMGVSKAIIQRRTLSRGELSSLFWLNLAAGWAVAAFVAASARPAAALFGMPLLESVLLAASLIFVFTPLGQQAQYLLERDLRFRPVCTVEMFAVSAGVALSLFLAYQGVGVMALVWGQVAVAVLKSVGFMAFGWRKGAPQMRFSRAEVQPFLGFGLFQMGERAVTFASMNLDKVLVGKLLGPVPLGLYQVAQQVALRPMSGVNPIVTRVAFSVFSRYQENDSILRAGYRKVLQLMAFWSAPLYLGLLIVSPYAVRVLLGPQWGDSLPIVQVFCLVAMFWTLGNPIGTLILAKGRAGLGFVINLLTVAIYAVAVLVGSHEGAEGVAWAILAAIVFILFPMEFVVRWTLVRMRPREFFQATAMPVLLALAMAVGVGMLDLALPAMGGLHRLIILGTAGAILYMGLSWFAQRALLLEVWRGLFPRRISAAGDGGVNS